MVIPLAWTITRTNFTKLTAKLQVSSDGQFFLMSGKLAIKDVIWTGFVSRPLSLKESIFLSRFFVLHPRLTGIVSPSKRYYWSLKVGVSKNAFLIFGFHARILRAARKCSSDALSRLLFRLRCIRIAFLVYAHRNFIVGSLVTWTELIYYMAKCEATFGNLLTIDIVTTFSSFF